MPNHHAPGRYASVPAPGNPRQTEAWALIESARRLSVAQGNPQDKPSILAAARLNWRLWTLLQSSLVLPETKLPENLRLNLLSLANFVDRQTVGILSDPDPEKLEVLIRVNRELASGLIAQVPEAEAIAQSAEDAKGTLNRSA